MTRKSDKHSRVIYEKLDIITPQLKKENVHLFPCP